MRVAFGGVFGVNANGWAADVLAFRLSGGFIHVSDMHLPTARSARSNTIAINEEPDRPAPNNKPAAVP